MFLKDLAFLVMKQFLLLFDVFQIIFEDFNLKTLLHSLQLIDKAPAEYPNTGQCKLQITQENFFGRIVYEKIKSSRS